MPESERDPLGAPSTLFDEWRDALVETARLGPVVDLACGRGRHALAAADLGLPVVAVDRKRDFLREIADRTRASSAGLSPVLADLEAGAGTPLRPGRCGAVLVFRYLHRPLAAEIAALLAPGALLLYETFTTQQRELGFGPTRDAFLLQPGELPTLFPRLEVLHHSEGLRDTPRPEATARLVARAPRA